MAISFLSIWKFILKYPGRFPRIALGIIWKIYGWLARSTANRGRATDTGLGHSSMANTSLAGAIPPIKLRATTPTDFGDRRYDKSTPNFSTTNIMIVAGHPSRLNLAPEGWSQLEQPEGQPYYYNKGYQLVTENHIINPDVRKKVEDAFQTLILRTQGLRSMDPTSTEAFIDVRVDNVAEYYLVDHKQHTLFWLSDVDSNDLGLLPAYSERHMALQRESMYWAHVEFFPMHMAYPKESEKGLISVLGQARLDGATSPTSTAVYSPGECKEFIKIIKNFQKNDGYKLWSLARIWKDIHYNRFIHLHGQQPARLHRLARLKPHNAPALPLIPKILLGIFFFHAQEGYINSLENIFVDGVAYQQHWKAFLEERLREWNAVTIMSTVLWTVGVGLLQVSSSGTSTLRALLHASTLCAMSSIVVSLLHDRQHRRRAKVDDSSAALEYASRHQDKKRGFLYLGMLYCLPYVLLLWSLLLAALATLVSGINSRGGIAVGVLAAVLGTAIAVTIWRWNVEGSLSDAMLTPWTTACGKWKNIYLRLLRDVVRGQRPSDTNPSPREEITAISDDS